MAENGPPGPPSAWHKRALRWFFIHLGIHTLFHYIVAGVVAAIGTIILFLVSEVSSVRVRVQKLFGVDFVTYLSEYSLHILTFGILAGLVFSIKVYVSRIRRVARISAVSDDISLLIARFQRDLFDEIVINIWSGAPKNQNSDSKLLCEKFYGLLNNFIDRISQIFSIYTGDNCHVCIKLYDKNLRKVRTIIRDRLARDHRNSIDEEKQWYSYKDNTAFESILDDRKSNFFYSNHLKMKSMLGKYKNSHEDWQKEYSATLVVPITLTTYSSQISHENVLGFLCLDNKKGGFDGVIARNSACSFSRICWSILNVLGYIEDGKRHQGA